MATPRPSADAQNLNWLLASFVRGITGVRHAAVVSSDGLLLASSEGLDREQADQLSALSSGLVSLAEGAARLLEAAEVKQTVVEMERGLLFLMAIGDGSCLSVLATATCDVGVIGYEMTLLVARAGDVLTPQLRAELQAALRR